MAPPEQFGGVFSFVFGGMGFAVLSAASRIIAHSCAKDRNGSKGAESCPSAIGQLQPRPQWLESELFEFRGATRPTTTSSSDAILRVVRAPR